MAFGLPSDFTGNRRTSGADCQVGWRDRMRSEMDGTVSVGPSRPPNQFGTLSMAFGLKYWTLRLSLARSQGPRTAGASCQAAHEVGDGWDGQCRSF